MEATRPEPDADAAPLLEARGLSRSFRGLHALVDYELSLAPLTIHGVIGPNGAGKTTLFHLLSGFLQPTSGTIAFAGRDITGASAFKVARMGVGRTFQNIRLFGELSVLDNVKVALQRQSGRSTIGLLLSSPSFRRAERELDDRAMELLELFGLAAQRDRAARNLPYGDQRRLEIARAMATRPKLLCLDEPAAGFNPAEKQRLMDLIRKVRDQGYTVLLIEHDMKLVMGVTDRIVVLEFGRKIAEGLPAEIRDNPAVVAAYLGVDESDAS